MRGSAPFRPRAARRAPACRHRRPRFELLESRALLAPFTPGNLLVYRLGDGAPLPTGNVATAVFLDEVDPAGNVVQSLAAPTTDSGPHQTLTASPLGEAEGLLTLSGDGQYVLLTGYDAAPGTSGVTNSPSSTIRRVIGRLDADGNLDTTTTIADALSTVSIRSAYSTDGTSIWFSGGAINPTNTLGGVWHTTFGSTGPTTQISTAVRNTRGLTVAGGQLYVTTHVGSHRVSSIGTGTPTTPGQPMSPLPGIPFNQFGNDPRQAFFADLSPVVPGVDTVYIADAGFGIGLAKFSLVGGNWLPNGSVPRFGQGILSLAGRQEGNSVTLYATSRTANDTNNELLVYTDPGGFNAHLVALFQPTGYSAGPNRRALGVSFVPQAAAPPFDPDPEFSGTAGDDQFLLRREADNLVLALGGVTLLNEPAATINSLTIDAAAGHDRLTIDYSGGDPIPVGGLVYTGGSGNDTLTVFGTGAEAAQFAPHSNAISVGGSSIALSGLESVELVSLDLADISLPGGDNLLSLTGGLTSSSAPALILAGIADSVPITSVVLSGNASVSLTTGDGNDTVTIAAADNTHGNLNLHLVTGLGSDSIQIDGGLSVFGDLSLATQAIHFNQPASVLRAGDAAILDAGAGPILDHWPDLPSVVAPALFATAGSAIVLGTDVATLTADVSGSGGIEIAEAGAVVLGPVNTADGPITMASTGDIRVATISASGGNADVTLQSTTGSVLDDGDEQTIVAADTLTVISPQAIGSAGGSGHLDTAANVWVLTSSGGGIWAGDVDSIAIAIALAAGPIHLAAAGDLTLPVGSRLATSAQTTLASLAEAASGGSTISVLGDVAAPSVLVVGSASADTFHMRPDVDTPIVIDGFDPQSSPGDTLTLDLAGLQVDSHEIGSEQGSGAFEFVAAAGVSYRGIESLNVVSGAFDLVFDLRLAGFEDLSGDSDEFFVRLDESGTELLIDVDGQRVFAVGADSVRSLTILGSGDDDHLRIEDSAGGFLSFAGTSSDGHLNDTSRQLLDFQFPEQGPWTAARVAIHFDGRAGDDSIDLTFSSQRDTTYAPDALASAGSGNLFAATPAGPDFLMSFADVAALHLDSPGGQLLMDATSAAVTTLALDDDALPADGWSQIDGAGGVAAARFRGFDMLSVVGGNGSQSLQMLGLDAATPPASVLLHTGNTADLLGTGDTDAAADSLRVFSTPDATSVSLLPGGGDDLVVLTDAASSLDGILAPLHIDGGDGNDRLVLIDSGDATADSIIITESSLVGLAGIAGSSPAIGFANIDVLDLTATAAGDTIDANFAPGSDLDAVTLSGAGGDDQFLLTTSDESAGGLPTGIHAIDLFGSDGDDLFGHTPPSLIPGTPVGSSVRMIRPSASTLIRIDVGPPLPDSLIPGDQPGDVLNLDTSALAGPVLVTTVDHSPVTPGSANSLATDPGFLPVEFAALEDLNLVDRGRLTEAAMGDVFLRGTSLPEAFRFAPVHSDMARVQIGGAERLLTITGQAIVEALGGNDTLAMGIPQEAIFDGGDGDDTLIGNSAADKLVGGAGRDRIDAGGGDNTLWGDWEAAADALPGRLPEALFADVLTAGDGRDTVYGGPGIDQITAAGGDDWVHAGQGADVVDGGAGHDRLFGGDGNDSLSAGDGDDLADGGTGNDTLFGWNGHDVLIGGAGNDALEGEAGNDALFDGSLRIGGLATHARAKGDAADAALAALLADWRSDFAIGLALTNDFGGGDRLRGGAGRDAFSALSLAEILDLALRDDRRL